MIKLRKEDKLMPNSNKKIKPKKTEAKEKDVEQKPKTSKKETKLKAQKKKIYKDFRFWICVGVLGAVLIAVIVFLIINDKQHKEAVTKYEDAWKTYAKAQNEFGYEFGAMLGEMGFSTDGSTEYNIDSSAQNDISTKCAQKVGIYDEVYNNPYAVEDKNISVKSTSDIQKATDSLTEFANKINEAKGSVEDCREIGEAKKKEIDDEIAKKEAEEKAKAEEEAAKQRQKEESEAAYKRNKLDYDKFNNQIREGMSLSAVKEVYGWFDNECKVSSQSGGYVIYSCSSTSSYNYWAASFTFYNNVLKSKAQTGLK